MGAAVGQQPRILREASDVTSSVLADAEEVWDGWFADEPRIEWEAFIDRLSDNYGCYADPPYELDEYWNGAVRKIQRHVRGLEAR
jgi:hypothetical protein